jgi:hypothetical protein
VIVASLRRFTTQVPAQILERGAQASLWLHRHGDEGVAISVARVHGNVGCIVVHRCRSWALRCSPLADESSRMHDRDVTSDKMVLKDILDITARFVEGAWQFGQQGVIVSSSMEVHLWL